MRSSVTIRYVPISGPSSAGERHRRAHETMVGGRGLWLTYCAREPVRNLGVSHSVDFRGLPTDSALVR